MAVVIQRGVLRQIMFNGGPGAVSEVVIVSLGATQLQVIVEKVSGTITSGDVVSQLSRTEDFTKYKQLSTKILGTDLTNGAFVQTNETDCMGMCLRLINNLTGVNVDIWARAF